MTQKKIIILSISLSGACIIITIVVELMIYYKVGFPKCVGDKKYKFTNKEVHVEHDGINLYGRFLLPKGDENFPTSIYVHGAESSYKEDMTTLKSLAMSGIAIYT